MKYKPLANTNFTQIWLIGINKNMYETAILYKLIQIDNRKSQRILEYIITRLKTPYNRHIGVLLIGYMQLNGENNIYVTYDAC